MVVGQFSQDVDILVIGGGPAGYTAAFRCAELGKTVAVVDPKESLGGECLHDACIPSKAALLGSDGSATVSLLSKGLEQQCKTLGIERLHGLAHFENKKTVQVTGEVVSVVKFRKAIVASGSMKRSHPDYPDAIQVEETYSKNFNNQKILVVGDTPSAVESATYLSKHNAVSIFSSGPILPSFAPEIVKLIKRGLTISVDQPNGSEFDVVVLSGHRLPNIEQLHLEQADVTVENGVISTDDTCATSNSKIYAVGECAGCDHSAALAIAQGRVAGESACGLDAHLDAQFVPRVVWSSPELAQVGSFDSERVSLRWGNSGLAVTLGQQHGITMLGYEKTSQVITGVGIAGAGATELIAEGALALEMSATLYDVANTIHPHPTRSELLAECARLALKNT